MTRLRDDKKNKNNAIRSGLLFCRVSLPRAGKSSFESLTMDESLSDRLPLIISASPQIAGIEIKMDKCRNSSVQYRKYNCILEEAKSKEQRAKVPRDCSPITLTRIPGLMQILACPKKYGRVALVFASFPLLTGCSYSYLGEEASAAPLLLPTTYQVKRKPSCPRVGCILAE